jgi:hypothetical protein
MILLAVSLQGSCLQAVQESNEARTETYHEYVDGVLELLPQQCRKNDASQNSLAGLFCVMPGGLQ